MDTFPSQPALSDVDALAQLAFVVHGLLERRAAEQDLSLVQTRLLGILRDREPTMQELARLLSLDKSSVSGLVDRAARRGFVERIPSTVDRRAVTVRLTIEGRRVVALVAESFAGDVELLLAGVPEVSRRHLTASASQLLVSWAAEQGVDLLAVQG